VERLAAVGFGERGNPEGKDKTRRLTHQRKEQVAGGARGTWGEGGLKRTFKVTALMSERTSYNIPYAGHPESLIKGLSATEGVRHCQGGKTRC